ncbi:MAG: DUF192 domain-containing protein [Phycisphaerales bacterium JB043]
MAERVIGIAAACVCVLLVASCDTSGALQANGAIEGEPVELFSVKIKGQTYRLELALDDESRIAGLSGRESIPEKGGMLFSFPSAQQRYFVMRDCQFDIDIAYLDGSGKVISMHAMTVEPRREGESDLAYEQRLKRYPSFYAAEFAVEVMGGTWEEIGLVAGETIEFDRASVKERTR